MTEPPPLEPWTVRTFGCFAAILLAVALLVIALVAIPC